MRATALVCMLFLMQPAAWSQLDTIAISGTSIDTTKVYDGTTVAQIVTLGEYPLLPYSQVLISAEAHYLDAAVGIDKPVVVTFSLSGDDAYRYATPSSIILYADITPRQLTADSVSLQTIRPYDGTTVCEVLDEGILRGIVPGDTVGQLVSAQFNSSNASPLHLITVEHTLYGPQAGNYFVVDSNTYLGIISRREVSPNPLFRVQTVKEYDGTDTAHVILPPTLDNAIPDDDIDILLTANYDNPEVGDNKVIYTHFSLTGLALRNYELTADSVYPELGQIVLPIIFDTLEGDQQFVPTAYGFCQGQQVELRYHLRQGEPTHYRMLFSESEIAVGFDTNWVAVGANDSIITLPVPNGCPAKSYQTVVEFVNMAGISSFYPISFRINLLKDYLVQAFNDVISIDNSGRLDGQPDRFRTFQWYHNGEAIPNATMPYYQEAGGMLTGEYSLMVNKGTDDEGMVCPVTFSADEGTPATVRLMPTPVVNTTTVVLEGFADGIHQLQVYNSFGILLYATSFEGRQHLLDLSSLPQGTYLVTVDGRSAKTLKL